MSQALVHFSSFQLRWDISSGSKTSQKRKININILNLVALFLCVFLVNLITRYSSHIVHQRATTCILWTSSAVVKDSYWIVLSWSNSCFWKLEGCTDMANKDSNGKKYTYSCTEKHLVAFCSLPCDWWRNSERKLGVWGQKLRRRAVLPDPYRLIKSLSSAWRQWFIHTFLKTR